MENVEDKPKSKEERIVDFIKSINTCDMAMEPYREQKKELKKSYEENNWLTKEEIKLAVKALRMLKNDEDPEQLVDFFETLKRGIGQ